LRRKSNRQIGIFIGGKQNGKYSCSQRRTEKKTAWKYDKNREKWSIFIQKIMAENGSTMRFLAYR